MRISLGAWLGLGCHWIIIGWGLTSFGIIFWLRFRFWLGLWLRFIFWFGLCTVFWVFLYFFHRSFADLPILRGTIIETIITSSESQRGSQAFCFSRVIVVSCSIRVPVLGNCYSLGVTLHLTQTMDLIVLSSRVGATS